MIAFIEFTYPARDKIREWAKADDRVKLETLQSILPDSGSLDLNDEWQRTHGWKWETLIDTETDGPRLTELGLPFEVKKFKGTMPLSAVLPEGQRVQVYVQVPHVGLLAMNEVKVLEDCCTDRLQEALDGGWRILCVCPPNAARRPDYILGRMRDDKS